MRDRQTVIYSVLLVVGAGILCAGLFGSVGNVMSGLGGGLMGIAAVKLYLKRRYLLDPDYKRQVDIANADERNIFIAERARSFTLGVTIATLCLLGIVLQLLGKVAYGQAALIAVCLITATYWLSYLVISRRY